MVPAQELPLFAFQDTAEQHDLAEMIRIVVGQEQGFAQ
jgi:hypothetical protein